MLKRFEKGDHLRLNSGWREVWIVLKSSAILVQLNKYGLFLMTVTYEDDDDNQDDIDEAIANQSPPPVSYEDDDDNQDDIDEAIANQPPPPPDYE